MPCWHPSRLAWCLGYAAFFPGSLRPPAELALDLAALDMVREWAGLAGPAAGRWLAPHVPAFMLAAIFSLVAFDACRLLAGETVSFGLGNLGLAAAVAVVAAVGQPLPAAAVGVLGFGQAVFQPARRANGDEWFMRRAWLYVIGCMLLSALGVALMRA